MLTGTLETRTPTAEETDQVVHQIIAGQLGVDQTSISDDCSLDELNASTEDISTIITKLEERFQITIKATPEEIETVDDMHGAVEVELTVFGNLSDQESE